MLPEPHNQQAYDLFIGEVVAAWAAPDVFSGHRWHFPSEGRRSIHYLAGGSFFATGEAFRVRTGAVMSGARPGVYLAGFDVFLPDAAAQGERLKALAARHGFDGLFPLDNQTPPGLAARRWRSGSIAPTWP